MSAWRRRGARGGVAEGGILPRCPRCRRRGSGSCTAAARGHSQSRTLHVPTKRRIAFPAITSPSHVVAAWAVTLSCTCSARMAAAVRDRSS
eukprot:281065-Rhodomonas_salina.1